MAQVMQFVRATKEQSWSRTAFDGLSGGGKTLCSLILASVLARGLSRVAVIDTERHSASKYAPKPGQEADGKTTFDFDTLALWDNFAPQRYIEAIEAAIAAGYKVIVIDSLSHAWEGEGGSLDQHENAIQRQAGTKNSYTAWREVTVNHRKLVDTILQAPAHMIVTMRSKMEHVIEEDESGKKTIRKMGLAPVQRSGMEYEFDLVIDLDQNHTAVVSKSRCFSLADAVQRKPDAKWFEQVRDWLSDGTPLYPWPDQMHTPTATIYAATLAGAIKSTGLDKAAIEKLLGDPRRYPTREAWASKLKALVAEQTATPAEDATDAPAQQSVPTRPEPAAALGIKPSTEDGAEDGDTEDDTPF